MHLRPADFFTTNPALDVPGRRNEASVLVGCCADKTKSQGSSTNEATKVDALNHLQGKEVEKGEQDAGKGSASRRLSRVLTGMFKGKDKE